MNQPGYTFVYGVRAIRPTEKTTQAVVPYRVPWMGSVVGEAPYQ
jgi:hypothetical protein